MQHLTKTLALIFILIIGYSCHEITKYSEIPEIHYKSHISKDSVDILGNQIKYIELTFSVLDGDADFGLAVGDTLPPFDTIYNNNFFSTLFAKENGVFEEVDILLSSYRIPYLEVVGGKAYKADVKVEFEYFYSLLPSDTIKYEFHVYDKALNQSNIEETPEIIFD